MSNMLLEAENAPLSKRMGLFERHLIPFRVGADLQDLGLGH